MPNININIHELVCENPVFTHAEYTGTRYEFNLGWSSAGQYLSTIDPTVSMYLYLELYHSSSTTPYYSGSVAIPVDMYDTSAYMVNILNFDNAFTPEDKIVFKLTLAGEASCVNATLHEIPSNTIVD